MVVVAVEVVVTLAVTEAMDHPWSLEGMEALIAMAVQTGDILVTAATVTGSYAFVSFFNR